MGPQSIPLLDTKSMLACNALSLASFFGTHHFFEDEGDSSDGPEAEGPEADGARAVVPDAGPKACTYTTHNVTNINLI